MAGKGLVPVLRYVIGGLLIIGGTMIGVQGRDRYLALLAIASGLLILIGVGQLLGVGVERTADQVVCRFVPWFQSWFYSGCVLLPVIGVATVAMANAGESLPRLDPVSMRICGAILLAVTPLIALGALRQWRRCRLSIGGSVLTVGVMKPGPSPIVIPREYVEEVTTDVVTPGTQTVFKVPQVGIVYRSADTGAPLKTIGIGPNIKGESGLQLSVKPENLARALNAWKDGAANDTQLLDRVEALLRGRSQANASDGEPGR